MLISDLKRIEDGIGEKVGYCLYTLCTAIFSVMISFYYGWKLTLIILSVTPIIAGGMGVIAKVKC
jgi:ABC-type bacteriocin/lantibiotic exporter with double-glycine peptidase domain